MAAFYLKVTAFKIIALLIYAEYFEEKKNSSNLIYFVKPKTKIIHSAAASLDQSFFVCFCKVLSKLQRISFLTYNLHKDGAKRKKAKIMKNKSRANSIIRKRFLQ